MLAMFVVVAEFMCAPSISNSASLSIKTGLETIGGNFSYVQGHLGMAIPPHFDSFKSVDKSFMVGALGVGAEVDEPLTEKCYMGVSFSAGIPFMTFPFKMSDLIDPAAGVENMNEGDESRGNIAMAKMMLKGGYRTAMGPGEASISLGAGMILYSLTWKAVDQWWDNPGLLVMSGGLLTDEQPVKMLSTATPYGKVTTYSTSTATVPAVEATPSYYIKIGDNYKLGLEVPLSYTARQKLIGTVTSPSDSIVGVFPNNSSCNIPVVNVGGFNFAVYVVFCKATI